MDNEFLHKVNLLALQKETGLSVEGIAELVDISTQTVYRWAWDKSKNGNRPSYNALIRLLESGATVKTLFGVDVKPKPVSLPKEYHSPEFMEGVAQAIADMKAKGLL